MSDATKVERREWKRDQLLIALNLYLRVPFGTLHARNPEIIAIAETIGRSPSALAMKCCNFASFDPTQMQRGVKGLGNASRADREIWDEFTADSVGIAVESELARDRYAAVCTPPAEDFWPSEPVGPTEGFAVQRVRLIQRFFRDAVLTAYEASCSICTICLPELLVASHIIPWRDNVVRRADPRNGIALCALHDKAFDRGLLTFEDRLTVVVSRRAQVDCPSELHRAALLDIDGANIRPPVRFRPDPVALRYHREHVFRN